MEESQKVKLFIEDILKSQYQTLHTAIGMVIENNPKKYYDKNMFWTEITSTGGILVYYGKKTLLGTIVTKIKTDTEWASYCSFHESIKTLFNSEIEDVTN